MMGIPYLDEFLSAIDSSEKLFVNIQSPISRLIKLNGVQ